MARHLFTPEMRLRRQADFDRVHKGNAYAADDVLVVRASRNDSGITRLGVSLSRKVGNAVVRNRWKRLVREAFRLQYHQLPTSIDLVVRPRRGAKATLPSIRRSLTSLAGRVAKRMQKEST